MKTLFTVIALLLLIAGVFAISAPASVSAYYLSGKIQITCAETAGAAKFKLKFMYDDGSWNPAYILPGLNNQWFAVAEPYRVTKIACNAVDASGAESAWTEGKAALVPYASDATSAASAVVSGLTATISWKVDGQSFSMVRCGNEKDSSTRVESSWTTTRSTPPSVSVTFPKDGGYACNLFSSFYSNHDPAAYISLHVVADATPPVFSSASASFDRSGNLKAAVATDEATTLAITCAGTSSADNVLGKTHSPAFKITVPMGADGKLLPVGCSVTATDAKGNPATTQVSAQPQQDGGSKVTAPSGSKVSATPAGVSGTMVRKKFGFKDDGSPAGLEDYALPGLAYLVVLAFTVMGAMKDAASSRALFKWN